MFSLSAGSEIKDRNDPIDQSHPANDTTKSNIAAAEDGGILEGFSTIPTSAITYAPHTKTKTCQCFARRKNVVSAFTLPPSCYFIIGPGKIPH